MKLTKEALIKLIKEELGHRRTCAEAHPGRTHGQWERSENIAEAKNSDSVSKDKVQKLYDDWKPETDEGKLYKKQLGALLGEQK